MRANKKKASSPLSSCSRTPSSSLQLALLIVNSTRPRRSQLQTRRRISLVEKTKASPLRGQINLEYEIKINNVPDGLASPFVPSGSQLRTGRRISPSGKIKGLRQRTWGWVWQLPKLGWVAPSQPSPAQTGSEFRLV